MHQAFVLGMNIEIYLSVIIAFQQLGIFFLRINCVSVQNDALGEFGSKCERDPFL